MIYWHALMHGSMLCAWVQLQTSAAIKRTWHERANKSNANQQNHHSYKWIHNTNHQNVKLWKTTHNSQSTSLTFKAHYWPVTSRTAERLPQSFLDRVVFFRETICACPKPTFAVFALDRLSIYMTYFRSLVTVFKWPRPQVWVFGLAQTYWLPLGNRNTR